MFSQHDGWPYRNQREFVRLVNIQLNISVAFFVGAAWQALPIDALGGVGPGTAPEVPPGGRDLLSLEKCAGSGNFFEIRRGSFPDRDVFGLSGAAQERDNGGWRARSVSSVGASGRGRLSRRMEGVADCLAARRSRGRCARTGSLVRLMAGCKYG